MKKLKQKKLSVQYCSIELDNSFIDTSQDFKFFFAYIPVLLNCLVYYWLSEVCRFKTKDIGQTYILVLSNRSRSLVFCCLWHKFNSL